MSPSGLVRDAHRATVPLMRRLPLVALLVLAATLGCGRAPTAPTCTVRIHPDTLRDPATGRVIGVVLYRYCYTLD